MMFLILYLIKVNVALAVLYLFYKFLFSKDTFFGLRRFMLALICVTAFVYPLLNVGSWAVATDGSSITGQLISALYEDVLPEITIFGNHAGGQAGYSWTVVCLAGIYVAGVLFLLVRTLLEMMKIGITLHNSKHAVINGIRFYLSDTRQEPYSFFKWIYIHPESYSEKELEEILIHEQVHVRELHSVDILLVQLVIIVCWFNPFAWLIRSEMRINHEYLADSKVVACGYDKKAYQYHLLGLEHTQPAAANLYNNFSVLPLKKRIKMLNRKRTRSLMKIKYFMFVPVAALLVLFSNCANTETEKVTEEVKTVDSEIVPVVVAASAPEKTESGVYDVVEQMPEFAEGGLQGLMNYLAKNMNYPQEAKEKGTQGRVIVQFVVDTDGSLTDVNVIRAVDPLLDQEAVRVIKAMPKWKPGTQGGKAVRVRYTVPVAFRLQ